VVVKRATPTRTAATSVVTVKPRADHRVEFHRVAWVDHKVRLLKAIHRVVRRATQLHRKGSSRRATAAIGRTVERVRLHK
jgi:hypothetical protein